MIIQARGIVQLFNLLVLVALSGCFLSGHAAFDGIEESGMSDQELRPELFDPVSDGLPEPDLQMDIFDSDQQEDGIEVLVDFESEPDQDLDVILDPDVEEEPEPFDDPTWVQSLQLTLEETLMAVVETPEGHIVAAGRTGSLISHDSEMYVVKFDGFGNILWDTAMGGPDDDEASGLALDPDGGVIVTGTTHVGDVACPFLAKLDADGNMTWQRTLCATDSVSILGMTPLKDGLFFVYGSSTAFGCYNGWGALVDASGAVRWHEIMGHPSGGGDGILADGYAATWGSDGNILAAGMKYSLDQYYEMWLWRLDLDGAIVWQRMVGGAGFDDTHALVQATDGSIYLAGRYGLRGPDYSDIWVVKLDAAGTLAWQRSVNFSTQDWVSGMTETADGNIVVAGSVGNASDEVPWMAKFTPEGAVVWQRRYVFPMPATFIEVILSLDHGLIAVGVEDTSLGFIMKLTPEGDVNGPCSLIEETAFPVETPEALARDAFGTTFEVETTVNSGAALVTSRYMMQHMFCPE